MKQKECKDCWVAKTHHRIVKEIFEDIEYFIKKSFFGALHEPEFRFIKKKWLK